MKPLPAPSAEPRAPAVRKPFVEGDPGSMNPFDKKWIYLRKSTAQGEARLSLAYSSPPKLFFSAIGAIVLGIDVFIAAMLVAGPADSVPGPLPLSLLGLFVLLSFILFWQLLFLWAGEARIGAEPEGLVYERLLFGRVFKRRAAAKPYSLLIEERPGKKRNFVLVAIGEDGKGFDLGDMRKEEFLLRLPKEILEYCVRYFSGEDCATQ